MTTTVLHSPEPPPAAPEQPPRPRGKGWFAALVLRLHFYVGILIGPFILIAALTGSNEKKRHQRDIFDERTPGQQLRDLTVLLRTDRMSSSAALRIVSAAAGPGSLDR